MKRIIKFTAVILLTSFCLQSCDPFESEEGLETIRLRGICFRNSCNFEATYEPYSVDDSYQDNIHTVGQHVICTIGDKLYEVEFLEPGTRLSHFNGRFHVIKCEGEEVQHEDGIVWYYTTGGSFRLDTHSDLDTTFSTRYYEKSDIYGSGFFLPAKVIARIVTAIDTAYALDKAAEANGTPRERAVPYIRPELRYNYSKYWYFYYDEINGYYYQEGGEDGWLDFERREKLNKVVFDPDSPGLVLPGQGGYHY